MSRTLMTKKLVLEPILADQLPLVVFGAFIEIIPPHDALIAKVEIALNRSCFAIDIRDVLAVRTHRPELTQALNIWKAKNLHIRRHI
jgi:hypothetical protein